MKTEKSKLSHVLDDKVLTRIATKLLIRGLIKHKELMSADERKENTPKIAVEIDEDPADVQRLIRAITPHVVGGIVGCTDASLSGWVDIERSKPGKPKTAPH